ncbi:MAG TPA: DUF4097 family beta strand repeat-containing protein [Gemmatimonadales bacterium]|nr:DUF4097 family beta strand repeat-containing protein [Gemmatimonadales bacterium]
MRPATLSILALAAISLAGRALLAQDDDSQWLRHCERDGGRADRQRACEIRHLGFKPSGTSLGFEPDENGGVDITGWDRDSVAVTARIQADGADEDAARELLRGVRVEVAGSAVRVAGPSRSRNASWSVELVCLVPRRSGIEAATTNGPVSVDGVAGRIDVRATNGPLSLARVSGDVRARAQNGPLTVVLAGSNWEGKGLDAETVNGPVDLALPEHYNANLETGTVNGPSDFQYPLTVTLHGRGRDRIHTTLGQGGAPLRVVTTNGPLTVRRAGS